MPETKFVIISHLRSGTHLLRTLLESHPQIVCQSEVFNSDNPNLPYPLTIDAQDILNQWVYRSFPDRVDTVGFVLQAYHPFGLKAFPGIRENPHWADIWTHLDHSPELRIIHLRRDNSLRRHLSHLMARQTRRWHNWEQNRIDQISHLQPVDPAPEIRQEKPTLSLDFDRLLLDFEEVEQLHERVRQRYSGDRYFSLSYEDLCARPVALSNQLLDFLDVEKVSLSAAVKKLENRPLVDSIANYEQLKQRFAGSRWQRFFEEQD